MDPGHGAVAFLDIRSLGRRVALRRNEHRESGLRQDLELHVGEVVLSGGYEQERDEERVLEMLPLRAPRLRLVLQFIDVGRDVFARPNLPPGQSLEMLDQLAVRKAGCGIVVCHAPGA